MPQDGGGLRTLANIVEILQKSSPAENPLAHVVSLLKGEMGVDVCSLYLLQDKTLTLVATEGLDQRSVGRVRMKVSEGLTGLAVEKLQAVIVREASKHPRFKYFPETGEEKFHSYAAVPLIDRQQVVGVLTLQTVQPRDFAQEELGILKLIAAQLAGMIHNLVALEVHQALEERERGRELSGIAASPGFGIGTAFFLRPGLQAVILPPESDRKEAAGDEWKRLAQAMRRAQMGLRRLEKRLEKKFSKKEADIFYSHRMILEDKSFRKGLKGAIEKGRGAVEAVQTVIGEYIKRFQALDDPHFRERAADLEDIRERIFAHLTGAGRRKGERREGVLVAEGLIPSDSARLDPARIRAIVTEHGGVTSHAAILARSLGIPAVMGIPGIAHRVSPGDLLVVDGNTGSVFINPHREVLREYERVQEQKVDELVHRRELASLPAETVDGRRICLEANVGLVAGIGQIREFGAEGVGLYRTEVPFLSHKRLPTEEEQYRLYCQIVEEAAGLPVTFRTWDAGGDKPIQALASSREENPFLGARSIRLCLAHPEVLKTQLNALYRAAVHGPIRVMIPMISGVEDILKVKEILLEVWDDLRRRGVAFEGQVPLGIMIEVPSAVQMAPLLVRQVDFLSIGTNDLIQYTLAVDRNNEEVARFFDPLHPAVLQSIARVAEVALGAGKQAGICGEMAGDPLLTPLLIGLGVTELSMIPPSIPLVKKVIRETSYREAREMAREALGAATVEEARAALGRVTRHRLETGHPGVGGQAPSP